MDVGEDVNGDNVWDALDCNGSAGIPDGSVTSAKIAPGAVTNAKIAAGSITGDKIESGAVTGVHIADGSVGRSDLISGAVALDVQVVDGVTVDIPSGATQNVRVDCPSGYTAISGGWEQTTGVNRLYVPRSLPENSAAQAWLFQFRNDESGTMSVNTFAVCARVIP